MADVDDDDVEMLATIRAVEDRRNLHKKLLEFEANQHEFSIELSTVQERLHDTKLLQEEILRVTASKLFNASVWRMILAAAVGFAVGYGFSGM